MGISSNTTAGTCAGAVAGTLKLIETELVLGFNFERYNIAFDQIDLEHFRHALKLVRGLLAPHGSAFTYPEARS